MDQIKTTKDHHYINNWQGKTYCVPCFSHLTRPTCWCRRRTRKHGQRLLCLGGERRKGQMWNGPNKNNKGPPLSTIGKERRTVLHFCYTWHVPLADVGVERGSLLKGCCVWEEKEERIRCEMDQIKTTKDHHYQQLARKDLLLPRPGLYIDSPPTLDTSHLLMSPLNKEAPLKAVVFGRRKKKSQMWNGPNKTTKDHNYQQLARKDLLLAIYFTLDTSHLLMSVLNEEAPWKAVVFGRRKKKGSDVKWTN